MDWNAILNGALGAGVISIILKLIDTLSSRDNRITDAAKTIAEGGAQAVTAVRELLKEYDTLIDNQRAEIEMLKKNIADVEASRAERARVIQQMEKRIEDDLLETQNLKNEVILLRKQVAESEHKLSNYKQAVELLVTALKKAEVPLPPEVEHLLGDSIQGLKWPKRPE